MYRSAWFAISCRVLTMLIANHLHIGRKLYKGSFVDRQVALLFALKMTVNASVSAQSFD